MSFHRRFGVLCAATIASATHSISFERVSNRPTVIAPSGASGGASSGITPGCCSYSSAACWFAAARIRLPQRRLTLSTYRRAGDPSAFGKCSGNSSRLATEAPRHP